MSCARGNMNGYDNNLSSNNNNNNGNNDNNNNNNTEEYYGDYPFDNSDNGGTGGYKCHRNRTEPILEYNCGTNVNLNKMNVQDNVVAAQLTIDTEGNNEVAFHNNRMSANVAKIKIVYNCFLSYTATLNEEMDIMFKLYRQDSNGMKIELTSKPYTISFNGDLTTTNENVTESVPLQLEKNESFYTEYFDNVKGGGTYTYIMEVTMIYNSTDSSSLQSGYISAIGQISRDGER